MRVIVLFLSLLSPVASSAVREAPDAPRVPIHSFDPHAEWSDMEVQQTLVQLLTQDQLVEDLHAENQAMMVQIDHLLEVQQDLKQEHRQLEDDIVKILQKKLESDKTRLKDLVADYKADKAAALRKLKRSHHQGRNLKGSKAELEKLIQSNARKAKVAKKKTRCIKATKGGIAFVGCNVSIRNGSADKKHKRNGLGNLIIGYNEPSLIPLCKRTVCPRDGSHNLVVGPEHTYFKASNGIVAGKSNSLYVGDDMTIAGGYFNMAGFSNLNFMGGGLDNVIHGIKGAGLPHMAVAGGVGNLGTGLSSTTVGGTLNRNFNFASSMIGGFSNTVGNSGGINAVVGGKFCQTSIPFQPGNGCCGAVTGGQGNIVYATLGSVSGGGGHRINGKLASGAGGFFPKNNGELATVSGGGDAFLTGLYASVTGGESNHALGKLTQVVGGFTNYAIGARSSILGGNNTETTDRLSTIVGGDATTSQGEATVAP